LKLKKVLENKREQQRFNLVRIARA